MNVPRRPTAGPRGPQCDRIGRQRDPSRGSLRRVFRWAGSRSTWTVLVLNAALSWASPPILGQEAPRPLPADRSATVAFNDVAYAHVGNQTLMTDMVLPGPGFGPGPFPAVLVIHGGAWKGGDKADNRPILEQLARRGFVAVSPQYRFCPENRFPAQIHDLKAVVRWLKDHAATYRVDPDRLGAVGFSSGGHLAMLLGLTDPDDGLELPGLPGDGPDTRIRAVVNYFGPIDLTASDLSPVSEALVRDLLGGSIAEKGELARLASPLHFVTDDDPPILTFQGTRDPLVPYTQAIALTEAMTQQGVAGRVELMIGGGHGDRWEPAGGVERTLDQTILFLEQHLKAPSGSPEVR